MLKHYLLSTFRSLWNHRLYSMVSVMSLTLGLSVFSLVFLHVQHEISYNRHWPDSGIIYRLTASDNPMHERRSVQDAFPGQVLAALPEYLSEETEGLTLLASNFVSTTTEAGQRSLTLFSADNNFNQVFSPKVVEGNLQSVFDAPGLLALEEAQAETLFGKQDSYVGRTLVLEGSGAITFNSQGEAVELAAGSNNFEVVAVYSLPLPVTENTNFRALTLMGDYSANLQYRSETQLFAWMKLNKGVKAAEVNTQLNSYVDQHVQRNRSLLVDGQRLSDIYAYQLQALNSLYFSSTRTLSVVNSSPGNLTRTLTFSIVALLVLFAACSNVVSIGFARALERTREIGIRKSTGATGRDVFMQFQSEALLLSLVSLLPAIVATELFREPFAALLSIRQMPEFSLSIVSMLIGIALVVGLLTGFYPSFRLARLQPVQTLRARAGRMPDARVNLRSVMVGVQYVFSILLLVITLSLYVQLAITRAQPLGFNPENLLVIRPGDIFSQDVSLATLNEQLKNIPGITASAKASRAPGAGRPPPISQLVRDRLQADAIAVRLSTTLYPGLIDVLEIPLLAGRDFEAHDAVNPYLSAQDEPLPIKRVLINLTTSRSLGYSSPDEAIGEVVYQRSTQGADITYIPVEIIGVVGDSMYENLSARPSALLFTYLDSAGLDSIGTIIVARYEDSIEGDLRKTLTDALARDGFDKSLSFSYLEDQVSELYLAEQRESRLMLICAGVTLFLSCIGLYGLVSLSIVMSTKEVGIRKVLGASNFSMMFSFMYRYSVPVLAANIIAWPVSVYFVLQWIERFPYQFEKFWLVPICLFASGLVLLIAWVTVSALTYKAASQKPVLALRYE